MTEPRPRRLVTAAMINGAPARILAAIMSLSEVERRLDTVGYSGPQREATLDAWRAVIDAGELHAAAASGSPAGQVAAMVSDSERDTISTTEAADMLGLRERRIRQLAAAGSLPGRKSGGHWSFERADVAARLQRGGRR